MYCCSTLNLSPYAVVGYKWRTATDIPTADRGNVESMVKGDNILLPFINYSTRNKSFSEQFSVFFKSSLYSTR